MDDDVVVLSFGRDEARSDLETKASETKTPDYLTKFEEIKILGIRSMQLRNNAHPTVAIEPQDYSRLEPIDVARMELRERMLPFIVRRRLPDGSHEDRRVDRLKLLNDPTM